MQISLFWMFAAGCLVLLVPGPGLSAVPVVWAPGWFRTGAGTPVG